LDLSFQLSAVRNFKNNAALLKTDGWRLMADSFPGIVPQFPLTF
jgi:hypothetical protein